MDSGNDKLYAQVGVMRANDKLYAQVGVTPEIGYNMFDLDFNRPDCVIVVTEGSTDRNYCSYPATVYFFQEAEKLISFLDRKIGEFMYSWKEQDDEIGYEIRDNIFSMSCSNMRLCIRNLTPSLCKQIGSLILSQFGSYGKISSYDHHNENNQSIDAMFSGGDWYDELKDVSWPFLEFPIA